MNAEIAANLGAAVKAERRSRLINLRLTAPDSARLRRLASEAGIRPAEAARLLVLRSLNAIDAKGAA